MESGLRKVWEVTCCTALIVCAILWFVAPFMHRYPAFIETLYIIASLISHKSVIGIVAAFPLLWAAPISGIGIAACLFSFTTNINKATTRTIALVTNAFLAVIFAVRLCQEKGNVMNTVGIGYVGIFVLLLLVYLICRIAAKK